MVSSSISFISSSSSSQTSPNPTTTLPDLSTRLISVQILPRDRYTARFSSDPQLIFRESLFFMPSIAMTRVSILLIKFFILAWIR